MGRTRKLSAGAKKSIAKKRNRIVRVDFVEPPNPKKTSLLGADRKRRLGEVCCAEYDEESEHELADLIDIPNR